MGAAPQSVDDYIQSFQPEIRAVLESVRKAVLAVVPGAEERLSYQMPAVFMKGVVVYYAAFKKHLGLFPPVQDPVVRARVAQYAGPKGNLQFPFTEPVPLDLIALVARTRLESNFAKSPRSGSKVGSKAKRPSARGAA